jgi:hypothetical protein
MKHQPVPQPKTLTHIYVRDAQKAFVRPCWTSGGEVYCGMCMRGEVSAEVGSVCPICGSTVERILEVADGGAPKFTRHRSGCSIRLGAARTKAGGTVLLDFTGSQGVSA